MQVKDRPNSVAQLRESLRIKLGRQFAKPTKKMLDNFEVEFTPQELAEKKAIAIHTVFSSIFLFILICTIQLFVFYSYSVTEFIQANVELNKLPKDDTVYKTLVKVTKIESKSVKRLRNGITIYFDDQTKKSYSLKKDLGNLVYITREYAGTVNIFDLQFKEGDFIPMYFDQNDNYYFDPIYERNSITNAYKSQVASLVSSVFVIGLFWFSFFIRRSIRLKNPNTKFPLATTFDF